jgi:predicted nucleic acid-binding protein
VNVLVDAVVWSTALRRTKDVGGAIVDELEALIREGRVVTIGAIRQELLSGVRRREQFEVLREKLRAFAGPRIDRADYENAAACYNECRARGVQGGHVDMLICAVALRRDLPVFSTDGDFPHYARVLGLRLHEPR